MMNTDSQASLITSVDTLRVNFNNGITRSFNYRQRQLDGIARFLKEYEQEIETALAQDLRRPKLEAYLGDIALISTDLKYIRKHFRSWLKPERVKTALIAQPGKSMIYHEPLGVVLIIAPWNYPFLLTLSPLIGAIAAGNCAVIKPSELAPASSALLAKQLPKYIDSKSIQIVEGGVYETTELLKQKFDHIFYTGNAAVAKIVMEAAAKNLTPVTFELGGKNPCIVDQEIDLDITARRILWGKFYNAGQTCIAPDYVLVHETIEEKLLAKMQEIIKQFYGDDSQKSPDFGRIINRKHFQRLLDLLSDIPEQNRIIIGNNTAIESERYIPPTILRNVDLNSKVMQEEIFGPILPVIKIKNINEAIALINARPKSLALYLFSNNKAVQKNIIENTSSGNIVLNHTAFQLSVSSLPFGGIGASGMGAYRGKTSVETFSHRKAVLSKPQKLDISLIYPPYNTKKMKWLRWWLI